MSEDILFMDHPSWKAYISVAITGVMAASLIGYGVLWQLPKLTTQYPSIQNRFYPWVYLVPVTVFLLFLLIILFQRYSQLYTITSNMVISRQGIIAKNTNSVPLNRITDINVRQSITGRFLHIGDIYIDTAGGPGMEAVLWGVELPFRVQNIITDKTATGGGHHGGV